MSEWSSKETQRALAELAEPLPGTRIGPQLHAFSDAQLIDYERMIEARVRAEVAEGRGKIVDEALMAARDDLVKTADRLRAKARETGDKTHFGTAAGVSLACLRLVELADRARTPDLMAALKAELAAAREAPKAKPVVAAAGSSPDTTPGTRAIRPGEGQHGCFLADRCVNDPQCNHPCTTPEPKP